MSTSTNNTTVLTKAPKSYINKRRPPYQDALGMELEAQKMAGKKISSQDALNTLEEKGYYFAHARPWQMRLIPQIGRISKVVIYDKFGDLICEMPLGSGLEDAELIIAAVNAYQTETQ